MASPLLGIIISLTISQCISLDPWYDMSLPLETRLDKLLSSMTFEEKIAQTLSSHLVFEETDRFLQKYGKIGFGVALPCPRIAGPPKMPSLSTAKGCVEWRNRIQLNVTSSSRLKIPISFREELLHSAGVPNATVFPMPLNMGRSWNVSLVRNIFERIAQEAKASGVDLAFAPVLNLATNALWGRGQECYGEDPMLVTEFANSATSGLSGLVCQGKHFFAYGHIPHDSLPVDLSESTLHDVYLRPWKSWVEDSGGRSVMATHPPINGVPMVANRKYLSDVLRGWNSTVSVASDNGDVAHLYNTWNIASSKSDAAALAMRNGLDQELSDGIDSFYFETMSPDSVDESVLNRAARNVLRLKFMAKLFDNTTKQPDPNIVESKLQNAEAQALSLDAARQSVVLLVNNGNGVPFEENQVFSSRIFITGPFGGCNNTQQIPSDKLCSARTALIGGYAPQFNETIPTIEESFRDLMIGKNGSVHYTQGSSACFLNNESLVQEAANEIRDHDIVVVVVGDTGDKDPQCQTCGEGKDRTSLTLSGDQSKLVIAILDAAEKRQNVSVVIVLIHGRPITFENVQSLDSSTVLNHSALTSIISAGRPGPFGSRAIVDLLVGKSYQFTGKLTRTWPANAGQVVSASAPWFQFPLRGGGISDLYAFNEAQAPLFPFAHGIIPGNRGGSALVAVFYSPPFVSGVLRYSRRLVKFTRVYVNPGKSIIVKDLVVNIERDLTRWDEYTHDFLLDEGKYGIHVGDCVVTGVLPRSDVACSQVSGSFTL